MIEQGKYNLLKIIKRSSFGLFLGDDSGEEVLLPTKYCTEEMKPGGTAKVFIYRDSEGKKIATSLKPKLLLHEFALLKVSAITEVGAFLEWGLEKELLLPFREQKIKVEEGRSYIAFLNLDKTTDRLYASTRLDRFLQNEVVQLKAGEEVSLVVWQKTDLGYSVIVNHAHRGLIYENEIFQDLAIGDRLTGFVKSLRPDQKIDVVLQAPGSKKMQDSNAKIIFEKLENAGGRLPFTDKSQPEEIYAEFGLSKKAFKKALGALYKLRKIHISEQGISVAKKP